ncbi:hypothetical protein HMPREF0183_1907 [Brevibacterium mcbrellneri ATCC 49030]|uniref:Uncharacterized protein n=1 Tax=Brevibacterium mcbrellneri ATCC 49030 TaxID=585530 RepID=D4YPP7_9MICO|nr:hypothetical protein HMPREF0183_1907 [Brevibacterium mcbrellneri ATCC 49030]
MLREGVVAVRAPLSDQVAFEPRVALLILAEIGAQQSPIPPFVLFGVDRLHLGLGLQHIGQTCPLPGFGFLTCHDNQVHDAATLSPIR